MIAIPEKDFAFIHIPKTAGTSLTKALKEKETTKLVDAPYTIKRHKEKRLKYGGHPPRTLLEEMFPEFICEHTFAVVRNPYDRLLSAFLHTLRDKGYSGAQYPEGFNFENWLLTCIEKESIWTQPMTYWIDPTKDTCIKYEELHTQLYKMENILGYKLELGRHNESMQKLLGITHHNNVIQPKVKKLINKIYQEDIELFEYGNICK